MTQLLRCISPIDQSVYAERPPHSPQALKAALTQAHAAQKEWANVALGERIKVVMAGVEMLGSMNDEVVPELARMMGRPVRFRGEFHGVKERSSYMASIAHRALKSIEIEHSDAFERRILRVPHGLILVIAPWNYPYMTAINSVVPGLIAGNAVCIKHSPQTLLAGERMVHAFVKAGLPEALFQNLYLSHEQSEGLLKERAFDYVNFTGSVDSGAAIEKAAAGTFTPMGLELGGKDPAFVMSDANLETASHTLVDGALFNSGQSCCGIERIYVESAVYDEFVERCVALVKSYQLGNPLDENTNLGPMAHRRFAAQVRTQTQQALSLGAKALIDTRQFADDGGAYLAPQILVNVNHDMNVMKRESFGPVLGIMKVKDEHEALRLINDSPYGLTASLWTQNPDQATRLGKQIDTGTVFMNRADYLDPALCWTGRKDTGKGGALSEIGFHNLTRPQSFHFKK